MLLLCVLQEVLFFKYNTSGVLAPKEFKESCIDFIRARHRFLFGMEFGSGAG